MLRVLRLSKPCNTHFLNSFFFIGNAFHCACWLESRYWPSFIIHCYSLLLVNLLLWLKNHLVHAWPCTQNRDVKRFTLSPTSIAQHKRKFKSSLSFTTSDIVYRRTQPREYSGGSRGGAWAIIFRPEWGSKSRKCYFKLGPPLQ